MTTGRPVGANADAVVAGRIRAARARQGITQQQLAARVGVTYQQAHKYETGMNRLSAGRLVQIMAALGLAPDALMGDLVQAVRDGRPLPAPWPHDAASAEIEGIIPHLTTTQRDAVLRICRALLPAKALRPQVAA